MSQAIRLFSAARCPYAQRTRIVLGEKGLDFDLTEVDLDSPSAEFLEASPYGKVPLLAHADARVWESSVINEYIEECFGDSPLMPRDAARRAWLRDWVDHANSELAPCFYKLLNAQSSTDQAQARSALAAALRFLDREGLGSQWAGDYLLGDQPTLADIAYYPFFERLPAVVTHRAFEWPRACDRLAGWYARMSARPAVAATCKPADYHIENYSRYARGEADLANALATRDR